VPRFLVARGMPRHAAGEESQRAGLAGFRSGPWQISSREGRGRGLAAGAGAPEAPLSLVPARHRARETSFDQVPSRRTRNRRRSSGAS
jgi:hypothetical protein